MWTTRGLVDNTYTTASDLWIRWLTRQSSIHIILQTNNTLTFFKQLVICCKVHTMSRVFSSLVCSLLLSTTWALAISNTAVLTLSNVTTYPTARCLDGSPFAYYIRPGVSDGANKWMVMLEGGGFCSHIKDCTERSFTDLGSSVNYSATMDLGEISFMTADEQNPFREWNQVYVRYCDGSMWMANRTNNDDPETGGLWITGHNNVAALIAQLSGEQEIEYGARKVMLRSIAEPGSTVILSGGSAGGIGAFNNVDFLARTLPDSFVLGAPVGGFPPELFW